MTQTQWKITQYTCNTLVVVALMCIGWLANDQYYIWQYNKEAARQQAIAAEQERNKPLAGDVNLDNRVDNDDMTIIMANWGLTPATRAQGDLTGDGKVDGLDQSTCLSNWNKIKGISV